MYQVRKGIVKNCNNYMLFLIILVKKESHGNQVKRSSELPKEKNPSMYLGTHKTLYI